MGWLALVAKKKKSSNDRWLLFTQTQPEQHTHRGQYNISREYYYETFKPPLSGRISIRCPTTTLTLWIFFFLFAFESRHKTKIPATPTGKSLCGVFFPLPHLASFALLSLVCLTSLFDPRAPPPTVWTMRTVRQAAHISRTSQGLGQSPL